MGRNGNGPWKSKYFPNTLDFHVPRVSTLFSASFEKFAFALGPTLSSVKFDAYSRQAANMETAR